MATRPQSHSTQTDVSNNLHVKSYDTILASGGVEVAVYATGAFATAAFEATRVNDIAWSIGAFAISFVVAGAAREDTWVRDASLAVISGSAAVLGLRIMNKLVRVPGQQ